MTDMDSKSKRPLESVMPKPSSESSEPASLTKGRCCPVLVRCPPASRVSCEGVATRRDASVALQKGAAMRHHW